MVLQVAAAAAASHALCQGESLDEVSRNLSIIATQPKNGFSSGQTASSSRSTKQRNLSLIKGLVILTFVLAILTKNQMNGYKKIGSDVVLKPALTNTSTVFAETRGIDGGKVIHGGGILRVNGSDHQVLKPVLPLCYTSADARFRPLEGHWVKHSELRPSNFTYWNLSCPLLGYNVKRSCSYLGKNDQAMGSATTRFEPTDCRLERDIHDDSYTARLSEALTGRRIFFYGDSLLRQVLTGWGCSLLKRGIVTTRRATNFYMRLTYPGRPGIIKYLGYDLLSTSFLPEDVLITESGVHGPNPNGVFRKLMTQNFMAKYNQSTAPIMVHMITWSGHFATETGLQGYHGDYNETLVRPNGPLYHASCVANVSEQRQENEFRDMKDLLSRFYKGAVWLRGLNSMGNAKVGVHDGNESPDCQHYCLPGPPDEVAIALERLIMQLLQGDKT